MVLADWRRRVPVVGEFAARNDSHAAPLNELGLTRDGEGRRVRFQDETDLRGERELGHLSVQDHPSLCESKVNIYNSLQ